MSKKMLRKKDDGQLFPYTELLAARDDMEVFEQIRNDGEIEMVPVPKRRHDFSAMRKKELIAYVFDNFGEQLDPAESVDALRAESEIIAARAAQ